jgi:AraC family transcriptional regulator of adaptative response/methylated-DNA-[protein]-cysteine methyltransferase
LPSNPDIFRASGHLIFVVEVITLKTELRVIDRPEVMDDEARWEAAASRDSSMRELFVIAVTSTGIYCRPGCPARMPKRENVRFFADCDEAEAAGFRACLRCKPRQTVEDVSALVRRACEMLEDTDGQPPTLTEIGERLGTGAARLQRLFRTTLGVTPREYADARRLERLKEGLRDGHSVTDALYDAGYGSSSRLYESASDRLGMTPGKYRKGGRGMHIRYATAESEYGHLLVAGTDRGVCSVRLADTEAELGVALRSEYPEALIERDDDSLRGWTDEILEFLRGTRVRLDVPLDIQGTAFQFRVWRALQQIGYGSTKTYGEVAAEIGKPGAARAVGNACGSNPVALVIPCHRVTGSNGALGGYGLGIERKKKLLAQEARTALQQATA